MVPGAASSAEVQIVWMESMATMPGDRAALQRGENVLHTGGRTEPDRRIAQIHPRGAQAHLRHRLLAGDVDRAAAGIRIGRQRLKDDGRFADARIAADQQRRTRHQSAAADAVEFRDAGGAARRLFVGGLQILKRELPPARAPARLAADGRRSTLLDNRVPAAARIAFARPFRMDRAAGLADERRRTLRHDSSIPQPSRVLRPSGDTVARVLSF